MQQHMHSNSDEMTASDWNVVSWANAKMIPVDLATTAGILKLM